MTHEQKAFLSKLADTATPDLTKFLLKTYTVSQAEEILQETYLAACLEVETLIHHEKPEAWLFTAAAFRGKRLVEKLEFERKRYAPEFDEQADPGTICQKTESGCRKIKTDLPRTTILCPDTIDEILPTNTPDKDRKVLKMYYEQKLSSNEIAEELGETPGNARQLINRARGRLKKALGGTLQILIILL